MLDDIAKRIAFEEVRLLNRDFIPEGEPPEYGINSLVYNGIVTVPLDGDNNHLYENAEYDSPIEEKHKKSVIRKIKRSIHSKHAEELNRINIIEEKLGKL